MFDFTTLLELYFLVGYIVAELDDLHELTPPQTAIKPTTNTSETRAFAYFFIVLSI